MAISSNTTGLRPGVCTSTSRPSSPYEGQSIYQTDTDTVLFWDGSSWVAPYATTSALNLKANIASPTFTGNVVASNGWVNSAGSPSVFAVRSGNLSYNNGAQNVPIVFNSASVNVGNNYNTGNGLLTAPVTGDYLVSCGVYNEAAVDVNQLWTVINGVRGFSIVLSSVGGLGNMAGAGVVRLNAGDTFGMAAWFGGSTVTITANSLHTFLRIRYIG